MDLTIGGLYNLTFSILGHTFKEFQNFNVPQKNLEAHTELTM